MKGIRDGRLGLEFDEARLNSEDFYALMPGLYARQMAIRFFLFPVVVVTAVVALVWGTNSSRAGSSRAFPGSSLSA